MLSSLSIRVYALGLVSLAALNAQNANPLAWSRYLPGGTYDVAKAVAVERSGDVWVAGHSTATYEAYGPNEPYQLNNGGSSDIFLAKFRPLPDGNAIPIFFTWLGGTGREELSDMKLDSRGRVVLTGTTSSSNFPIAGAPFQNIFGGDIDAFVAVIDQIQGGAASLVYSSYYGATGREMPRALAISPIGNVAVVGDTTADDLPNVSSGAQPNRRGGMDAFVIYFNPDEGPLKYASYFGGSSTDTVTAVGIDSRNRIWFGGSTGSDDFPLTDTGQKFTATGYLEGYLALIDPAVPNLDGFLYATLIGGSASDEVRGLAIDQADNIWVAGITFSTDLPVTPDAAQTTFAGGTDAFVMKIDPSRSGLDSILYSSYLGGEGYEFVYGFRLLDQSRVALAGYSMAGTLPTTDNAFRRSAASAFPDGMLGIINSAVAGRNGLEYLSYFGGTSTDVINGIDFDPANPRNVFIAGYTTSLDLPVTDGSARVNAPPSPNAFVTKILRP